MSHIHIEFGNADRLIRFLVGARGNPKTAPGQPFHEQHLTHVLTNGSAFAVVIPVSSLDYELKRVLENLCRTAGAQLSRVSPPDQQGWTDLSVEEFLQTIRLKRDANRLSRAGEILATLTRCDDAAFAEFIRYLRSTGVRELEAAFAESPPTGAPSYFVRALGLEHPGMVSAWRAPVGTTLQLYLPAEARERKSRVYVQAGWRLSVASVASLIADRRELVLLAPRAASDAFEADLCDARWITFARDSIDFFHPTYDFLRADISGERMPPIEIREAPTPPLTPLHLTLVQARGKQQQVWQLGKEIDRQKRLLQELEIEHRRLDDGNTAEVYFAYRFDVPDQRELHPQLARLMRQRVATLREYEYAWCKTDDAAFHLVIARRTQRNSGFSLQPADRVYYQPASWRQWGLNLYLPLGIELMPIADTRDSVYLLQELFAQEGRRTPGWVARLWEPGGDDAIVETRIESSRPLLEQVHLLNTFQPNVAARVEQNTRDALAQGVLRTREAIDDHLTSMHQVLLDQATQRTECLEQRFTRIDGDLTRAENLAEAVEPRVREVAEKVLRLPQEWFEFIAHVAQTHERITAPPLEAFDEFCQTLNRRGTETLRIESRAQKLIEHADEQQREFRQRLEVCGGILSRSAGVFATVNEIADQANKVCTKIEDLHRQMRKWIKKVAAREARAREMEREIEHIDKREKEVDAALARLKPELQAVRRREPAVLELEKRYVEENARLKLRRDNLDEHEGNLHESLQQIARELANIESSAVDVASQIERLSVVGAMFEQEAQEARSMEGLIAQWDESCNQWAAQNETIRSRAAARLESLKENVGLLESQQRILRAAERLLEGASQQR